MNIERYGPYNLARFLFLRSKRKKQLTDQIPDIFKYRTVLYIGANKWRMDFGKEFRNKNYKIDVIEIYPPNIERLRKVRWLNKTILGDVRKIDKLVSKKYDVIFWWHGPEHIAKKDLSKTLSKLKKIANHLVVCGCPYGKVEQDDLYGNAWERHVAYLEPKDFLKQGFKTSVIGKKNILGSNILSWYRK